ncbi:MAG TPA: sugar phosphate nucleotidyltransferase [Vicinamibacterales bacterium]|nr:sugar phosphate nucleotidyltransferase [Vicinamibacterales bacterium]
MIARTAVVLARGLGTRMRRDDDEVVPLDPVQARVASAGLKAMIPLAGRPFLDYVLSGLADGGFARALLVVAPEHDAIGSHYAHHPPTRLAIEYAVQAEPRGTADAVLAIEPLVERDAFVVVNGDNYYPVDVLETLRTSAAPCVVLFDREALVREGNIPPERVAAYAIVTIDADGYLASVEEKPDVLAPGRQAISMNCWRFGAPIFEACRAVPPSPRGELELPRAVDYGIRRLGLRLRASVVERPVLDLSHRADVTRVAMRLRDIEPRP